MAAAGAEPATERVISDVETLKALSDPVRLRILETMVTAADETWTVKRLAAAMGVGPTKLYHHVNILEEREFIRVAGTRVVSGIIETSYRIAQLTVRLDRALLTGGDPEVQGSRPRRHGRDLRLRSRRDRARPRQRHDQEQRRPAQRAAHPRPDASSPGQGCRAAPPPPRAPRGVRRRHPLPAEPGSVPFGYLIALYPFPESTTTYPEATDD